MAQPIPSVPIHPFRDLSLKNFVLFAATITSIKVTSIAYKKDRNTSFLEKDLVAQNFEFTFCFVPRVGPWTHSPGHTVGHFQLSEENMTNARKMLGERARSGLIEPGRRYRHLIFTKQTGNLFYFFLCWGDFSMLLFCAENYSYIIIFKDASLLSWDHIDLCFWRMALLAIVLSGLRLPKNSTVRECIAKLVLVHKIHTVLIKTLQF